MKKLATLVASLLVTASAFAHFQMIYTPKSDITGEKKADFLLVFTHPADGKEAHDMHIGLSSDGKVKGMDKFLITHKGEANDYVKKLKEIKFGEHDVVAYDFTLDKKSSLRGGGDWGLVAVPKPYYEGAEDIYIQQITKVFVNKDGIATDWNERIAEGYPEIIPMVNPTDVWVGGVFTGQVVDADGNPVAKAEIEIEYLNADIDMKKHKYVGDNKTEKSATLIYSDYNGFFTFVPTTPGYWGFAALGAGGKKEYNGKELSEDAVLWIEAK